MPALAIPRYGLLWAGEGHLDFQGRCERDVNIPRELDQRYRSQPSKHSGDDDNDDGIEYRHIIVNINKLTCLTAERMHQSRKGENK